VFFFGQRRRGGSGRELITVPARWQAVRRRRCSEAATPGLHNHGIGAVAVERPGPTRLARRREKRAQVAPLVKRTKGRTKTNVEVRSKSLTSSNSKSLTGVTGAREVSLPRVPT
jgi:hypothetical protein